MTVAYFEEAFSMFGYPLDLKNNDHNNSINIIIIYVYQNCKSEINFIKSDDMFRSVFLNWVYSLSGIC